ncbi:MAG: hypothetical protein JWO05_3914 [Gemmatimonadetes bacterium]|nr:hypothetical protein [Gemmatimonadota bacterium]
MPDRKPPRQARLEELEDRADLLDMDEVLKKGTAPMPGRSAQARPAAMLNIPLVRALLREELAEYERLLRYAVLPYARIAPGMLLGWWAWAAPQVWDQELIDRVARIVDATGDGEDLPAPVRFASLLSVLALLEDSPTWLDAPLQFLGKLGEDANAQILDELAMAAPVIPSSYPFLVAAVESIIKGDPHLAPQALAFYCATMGSRDEIIRRVKKWSKLVAPEHPAYSMVSSLCDHGTAPNALLESVNEMHRYLAIRLATVASSEQPVTRVIDPFTGLADEVSGADFKDHVDDHPLLGPDVGVF